MLALNNEIVVKIQKEVNAVEILNVEKTRNLRNLNGAVKEGLRLLNALPSGIQATVLPRLLEWKLRVFIYQEICRSWLRTWLL